MARGAEPGFGSDEVEGVVVLPGSGDVDGLLRGAVRQVELLGLEVVAVVDHDGDAAESGVGMPETKLVAFTVPPEVHRLMAAHPALALELPFRLLIAQNARGRVQVSYTDPGHLARRFGLSGVEMAALTLIETVAERVSGLTGLGPMG